MTYVIQTPHTLTLVVRKKYALTLCVWKAEWPGTRHPECICRGRSSPDTTCLDTHHLEEICPDTTYLNTHI